MLISNFYKRGYYMGNFFTSIQIHNPDKLSKEQFIELFCNKMKENGFDVSNAEDHEISYVLAFADNCKWVAIGFEAYEQGNAAAQKDAGNIAKMLNACCINIIVVDSDFAMLDMYSNTGCKLDTAVMGRADDYLGDDIPAPKKNAWSAFLSEGSTWECFTAVQQGNYIFVEDGLSELALLLGMNSRNILFDAEDANEFDENTCFLYFKKASTQKPKKITLNAAFKQVFGEALEPLGFKKVKSKYPYYARLVNDEILQVITVVSRPDKRFEILGGIATIYRQFLSLDLNPKMNESWLIGNFYYYRQFDIPNEEKKYSSHEIYEFYGADWLEKEMKRALNATKDIMLSIFDKVNSLEKCVEFYNFLGMDIRIHHKEDFGNSYPINYYNEGLLIIKTMNLEQYSVLMNKYKEITINRRKKQITNGGIPYERLMNEQEVFKNKKVSEYKALLNDKEWLTAVDIELNNRRNHNIKLLEEYGLI